MMISHKLTRQFTTYIFNGCCAAVAHYSLLILAVEIFNTNKVLASFLGCVAGVIVAFSLNSKFTFKNHFIDDGCKNAKRKHHVKAFAKYIILASSGIVINTSIFAYITKNMNIHYLITQAISICIVVFWNFTFCKVWVFREAK